MRSCLSIGKTLMNWDIHGYALYDLADIKHESLLASDYYLHWKDNSNLLDTRKTNKLPKFQTIFLVIYHDYINVWRKTVRGIQQRLISKVKAQQSWHHTTLNAPRGVKIEHNHAYCTQGLLYLSDFTCRSTSLQKNMQDFEEQDRLMAWYSNIQASMTIPSFLDSTHPRSSLA